MYKLDEVINLEKEYGSPLYIFHANEFKKNYMDLLETFRKIYPKYNIAYSYKTNYTPKICKIVKELGGLAEVVSEMEYRLAKKIGYKNKNIMFNGPVKGEALFEHLSAGGVVNIDNLDEMKKVVIYAQENTTKELKITFRVNIDIGQGFISRFGLDSYVDSSIYSELDEAFRIASNENNIKIVGLHCHIGRSRGLTEWKNRVEIMFQLVDKYFKNIPEFIDFGSGMNSVMEPSLAMQFGGHIPTYQEYAEIIATAMKNKYGHLSYEEQPILYTEPGTTVISGYMSFMAKVESIKNVKGKTYITFNGSGGNIGDICHLKQLPISVYHMGEKMISCVNATFVGYTCLEHDHIYEDFTGKIAVGDIVEFRNVGSYSNVFKPPFILPNCTIICENSIGNFEIIKNRETFDDIFHTYIF